MQACNFPLQHGDGIASAGKVIAATHLFQLPRRL